MSGSSHSPPNLIESQSHQFGDRFGDRFTEPESFVPVPLPTEIPAPPDFSSLPAHILHSGTVETLIGQNEDLMARLKVNLRRNSLLEQQIMEYERVQNDIKGVNESLQAQIQILIEKDRFYRTKNQKIEDDAAYLKSEKALLETKLSEFTGIAERKKRHLARLESYHRRIIKWVKPLVTSLKAKVKAEGAANAKLTQDLYQRDALISDLRSRLSETILHIQNQGRIYKKDQESLVEQYEHKISAIKTETERLKTDMSFFQERSARLEIVSTRQVEAENRVIFLERRKQEVEATLQADLKELRTSSAQLRQESMHLQIQLTQGKAELQQLQTQFKAVQNLCQETQIQRDELQNLWSESQKQSEENQLRLQSLQKINQELSRRVRDLRKANENQVIAPLTGMSSTDAPPKSAAVKADGPQAQMTGDAYARLDEIDSLLMGIQSGFAISRDREGEKIQKPELDPS